MEPGTYLLRLEKAGFALESDSQKTKSSEPAILELKAGQQLANLKLEMAPRSVISGHVHDEYGDPVAGWYVTAIPAKPTASSSKVVISGVASTDDRGEFRIVVRPGEYYIKTETRSTVERQTEIRTDGTQGGNYLETYYPGVIDADSATAVEVHSGAELNGIEIPLARSAPLRISGTVVGVPETTKSLRVILEPRSRYGPLPLTAMRDADGKLDDKFVFSNLEAGLYDLYAHCTVGNEEYQSQVTEITLTDSNVENISLTLASGSELVGVIESAGFPNAGHSQSLIRAIKLQPVGSRVFSDTRSRVGQVVLDGRFTIKGVQPGNYHLILDPLPEDSFVKAARLDGVEISPDNFEVTSGGELKITLSGNGGQLSGKVQDKDGKALHSWAMVFLAPDKKVTALEEVRSARIRSEGSYSFHGLPPGRYHVFATDTFNQNFWNLRDSVERMNRYAAAAEPVDVKEGDKITRDVKLYREEDEK
jgi:hypothetical protein